MAIEHAILVALSERSATGYDLARRFDASIGHFWRATHQQIYKVLARMDENGWVETEAVKRNGRLDKKTYVITKAGQNELLRWTREPSASEVTRSDFTVKLRGFADADAIKSDTLRRRAEHVATLATYEESEQRFYPNPAQLTGADLGSYLALRGGIHYERNGIAWCDEILAGINGRER